MKCPKCGGTGEMQICEMGFIGKDECDKCRGKGYLTNEEWFCSLPTEEKAKFLREMVYYGCLYDEWEQQSITENVPTEVIIVKWLKQPH